MEIVKRTENGKAADEKRGDAKGKPDVFECLLWLALQATH